MLSERDPLLVAVRVVLRPLQSLLVKSASRIHIGTAIAGTLQELGGPRRLQVHASCRGVGVVGRAGAHCLSTVARDVCIEVNRVILALLSCCGE